MDARGDEVKAETYSAYLRSYGQASAGVRITDEVYRTSVLRLFQSSRPIEVQIAVTLGLRDGVADHSVRGMKELADEIERLTTT